MQRLITLLLFIALVTGFSQTSTAQYEKEVGKVLFKNALMPCPAGPGKVAFLRLDQKIPGSPLELYVGDIKTLTETRAFPGFNFTDLPSFAYAWSPDGTEFVIPQKSGACWELFRFKAGNRTGEKITNLIEYREKLSPDAMEGMGLTEEMMLTIGEISYSPSGKRLIFTMNRPSRNAVWWHDLQTGKTRQATEDRSGYYPCFHPNDDQFCYTEPLIKIGISTDEDILLRSITTGDIDTLCHTRDMEFSGVISPDGKFMVYVKTDTNINNLYIMNLSTREIRQLTHTPTGKNCTVPRWSPDSKLIFFQASGFFSMPAVFVRDFVPF